FLMTLNCNDDVVTDQGGRREFPDRPTGWRPDPEDADSRRGDGEIGGHGHRRTGTAVTDDAFRSFPSPATVRLTGFTPEIGLLLRRGHRRSRLRSPRDGGGGDLAALNWRDRPAPMVATASRQIAK